jgi:hypothetical protein
MKFILSKDSKPNTFWNGIKQLPNEINVMSYNQHMAEFELLSIICSLHGYLTAFDLLTGSETDTEKDKDLVAVLTAFQMYIRPKMPLSNYSDSEKRIKSVDKFKLVPNDPKYQPK